MAVPQYDATVRLAGRRFIDEVLNRADDAVLREICSVDMLQSVWYHLTTAMPRTGVIDIRTAHPVAAVAPRAGATEVWAALLQLVARLRAGRGPSRFEVVRVNTARDAHHTHANFVVRVPGEQVHQRYCWFSAEAGRIIGVDVHEWYLEGDLPTWPVVDANGGIAFGLRNLTPEQRVAERFLSEVVNGGNYGLITDLFAPTSYVTIVPEGPNLGARSARFSSYSGIMTATGYLREALANTPAGGRWTTWSTHPTGDRSASWEITTPAGRGRPVVTFSWHGVGTAISTCDIHDTRVAEIARVHERAGPLPDWPHGSDNFTATEDLATAETNARCAACGEQMELSWHYCKTCGTEQ